MCDFGLYRDDGLGASKGPPRQKDLIKKKVCTIFSKNGLRIRQTNGKIPQHDTRFKERYISTLF